MPAGAGEHVDEDEGREQLAWALTAEIGAAPKTRSEHGAWGAAIAQLVEAGATAEQVRERCVAFRRIWPAMVLTPTALPRHWALLGGAVAAAGQGPPSFRRAERWAREQSLAFALEDAIVIAEDAFGKQLEHHELQLLREILADVHAQREEAVA